MANNKNSTQFKLLAQRYMMLRSDAPRFVGTIAVNFFKKSFDWQGQKINGNIKKWKKRGPSTSRRKGRKLLIDKGRLQRGVTKSVANKSVKIGVDATVEKYAGMMNDGGQIKVTAKMRKFFWAMYYQAMGRKVYSVKTKAQRKGKKQVAINDDADFWKAMALTKKSHIDITARPFIYHSEDLVKEINKEMTKAIQKILKETQR